MIKHTKIIFHVMAWSHKPYDQKPTKVGTFNDLKDAYAMAKEQRELNAKYGLSNWYFIESGS